MMGTVLALTILAVVVIEGFGALIRWVRSRRAAPPAPAVAEPEVPLTAVEVALIRRLGLCAFCGGYHAGLCRRVTEVWYHPAGGVKHAVLADEWDTSRTVWPEDLPTE